MHLKINDIGKYFEYHGQNTVAYPELVSRGVSKTCKFKWLVKVGASIYQTPDLKKNLGWGGFRATKQKPGYATGTYNKPIHSRSQIGNFI